MEQDERVRLQTRVARLEQQVRAFTELHATELGLVLDELAALRADLAGAGPVPATASAADERPDPGADPAAASPKRARWLAEEEARHAPRSRRELLRGSDRPKADP